MVFEVRSHENIGPGTDGVTEQKAPRSAAHGDFSDRSSKQLGVLHGPASEGCFQPVEKRCLVHRFWQFTDHTRSNVAQRVLEGPNAVSHLLIGMGCFHGVENPTELPRFHHHFQPHLVGLFTFADLTGKRLSAQQRPERSLALHRPPAFVVIPNAPRTRIEHRLLHRLRMILRHVHDDLHQNAGFGTEDALAFRRAAHEARQTLVHTVGHVIQVGVDGVQLNALANGRHDRALHVRRPGEPLQPLEYDGMMGNNQVGSARCGLGDDFLRAIERHQHTRDLGIPIADEQSGIVIRLLQRGRCPRFQLRDDIAHSKGLIGLHNSNVREVQNNAYF